MPGPTRPARVERRSGRCGEVPGSGDQVAQRKSGSILECMRNVVLEKGVTFMVRGTARRDPPAHGGTGGHRAQEAVRQLRAV